MCPACLSTIALIAAGGGTTGGLAALLAKTLRGKNDPRNPSRPASSAAPSTQEKAK